MLEFSAPGSFDPIDDMAGGGLFGLEAGQWTDDTSMALCLATSLLAPLIEQQFIKRPFVQFDDGTVVPVGTPDAVYGTIEFCQLAHNGQHETPRQRSQRIGNALGLYFEARVKEICDTFRGQHFVIHSEVIDEVMNRVACRDSKRADVIVGDAHGNYLVIEVTKRNLRSGIRYGDPTALDEWANDHLGKLEQATTTAEHLHAITTSQSAPTPLRSTCLVVAFEGSYWRSRA